MDIFKYDIYRGPNIGIFSAVNDNFVFVPNGMTPGKIQTLGKYLNADPVYTSISNTRLIGIMMVANNNGILVPKTCLQSEIAHLKKSTGLNVDYLDSKQTALGNIICANDKGALVSPIIQKEELQKIKDVLGVEVLQQKIAGYHQTGAMMVVNLTGGIIHPETEEDDVKVFEEFFKIKIEPATINGGIPFVASGILLNNFSAVVGTLTNGPEIMMITRAIS